MVTKKKTLNKNPGYIRFIHSYKTSQQDEYFGLKTLRAACAIHNAPET
jgi:hypothetical protein